MGQHSQTGLVAAASCGDYLRNIIKKHELTRVDKGLTACSTSRHSTRKRGRCS